MGSGDLSGSSIWRSKGRRKAGVRREKLDLEEKTVEQKNRNSLPSLSDLEVLEQKQEGSCLTVGSGDCSVAKMLWR